MKKLILTSLVAVFAFSAANAEKIDWDAAVKQTYDRNPSIQTARLRLENAQQSYNRALSGYMPDVSLRGGASQGESDGKGFSRSYSYGLNANLSIFSGFDTYNDVKQKSAELKAAQADYDRAVSDAAYNVAAQYVNLMWAYETVELSKKILERRTENKDMIQLKYNSGNADVGSLRRVEADVELSAYDFRKAQRYIETVSAALLQAIGRKDGVILETDEKLTLKKRELSKPDYDRLIAAIPEFLSAKYGINSYEAQAAKSKSAWWPSLSLSGSLGRSGNEWAPYGNSWDAGLSLSYPLFTGSKIADTKIAANQLKIAEENLKTVSNSLKANAVNYYNSLTDAVENIAAREFYLTASQQQAEISQRKYVNGLSTYQDWYSIENDYISSQKTLLDAKRSAALEKAKWHNFIGEGFVRPGQ
ncbi:MAG: TolC family protein [Endomicrobia bacterium]|nr:TolC family protein [Endomicrobiia bacterium]